MKFLGYLRIQKLLCQDDQKDIFMERNATVFAELIQSLDGRSLSLIMREAKDDGRRALRILCEHYLSKEAKKAEFRGRVVSVGEKRERPPRN